MFRLWIALLVAACVVSAIAEEPKTEDCASIAAKAKEVQRQTTGFTANKCKPNICGKKRNLTFDVDQYIADPKNNDTPVCLAPRKDTQGQAPDEMLWTSKDTLEIVNISGGEEGGGPPVDIFDCGPNTQCPPTLGHGSPGSILSPPLRQDLDPGKGNCYAVKATIKVTDSSGNSKCYDPHIYIGCDGCGLIMMKGKKRKNLRLSR